MSAADRHDPLPETSDDEEGRVRKRSGARKRATLAFGAQRAVVMVAHHNMDVAHAIAMQLDRRDHTAFLVAHTEEVLAQAAILRPHALVCSDELPGLERVEMRHAIGDAVGDPCRTAVIFVGKAARRGVLAHDDAEVVADAVEASLQRRRDGSPSSSGKPKSDAG